MTIAACYVSSEGVVLGADSTASFANGTCYNHAQKLFEIGEMGSTLGFVCWGLGGLPHVSYRRLVAQLSDELIASPPITVNDACQRWVNLFWREYDLCFTAERQECLALSMIQNRTLDQQNRFMSLLSTFVAGCCIGGRVTQDRDPAAFVMIFDPSSTTAPVPVAVPRNVPCFWGVRNLAERLISGVDPNIYSSILASGRWNGSEADLRAIVRPWVYMPPGVLPLRDAIDWIFSCIFVTIKAMKFASTPPICGGPIEVAVITADRPFRWVRHKGLDQALSDHTTRGRFSNE